jgi:hypothetical protein
VGITHSIRLAARPQRKRLESRVTVLQPSLSATLFQNPPNVYLGVIDAHVSLLLITDDRDSRHVQKMIWLGNY